MKSITDDYETASATTTTDANDVILNAKDAAKFLCISTVFLYQMTSAKKIPVHRIGGKLLFLKSELIDFVRIN